MNEFLNFNKMITPTIIKIIFWIGVAVSVITGLIMIVSSFSAYGSGVNFLFGLITIVVGPLLARVYCELIIVVFKMQEHLHNIDKNTKEI